MVGLGSSGGVDEGDLEVSATPAAATEPEQHQGQGDGSGLHEWNSDDEVDGGFGTVVVKKQRTTSSAAPTAKITSTKPTPEPGTRRTTKPDGKGVGKGVNSGNGRKPQKPEKPKQGLEEWDCLDVASVRKFESSLSMIVSKWKACNAADTSADFRSFWSEQSTELKKVGDEIKSKMKSCKRRKGMDTPDPAFHSVNSLAQSLRNVAKELSSSTPGSDALQPMDDLVSRSDIIIEFSDSCWVKKAKAGVWGN